MYILPTSYKMFTTIATRMQWTCVDGENDTNDNCQSIITLIIETIYVKPKVFDTTLTRMGMEKL